MVSQVLGVNPRRLVQLHASESPKGALALLVATLARHLDDLHEQLVTEALHSSEALTRVATGKGPINSLGILQNSGTKNHILAARRADAINHLNAATHAYQQVNETQVRSAAGPPAAKHKAPATHRL